MRAVVSIAGTDPSGGAGIQADIKTITAHRLFAETVVTALVSQNTMGVYEVCDVPASFVASQIDAVFDDIRPQAVKIGMVSSVEIIETIAERLKYWGAEHIVVDPVMVSTSGGRLIQDEAIQALKEYLIPLAEIITPNIPEAEVLYGQSIADENDLVASARELLSLGCTSVLVKGGHFSDNANDVLVERAGDVTWLRSAHIDTSNTHGTGCTLSSAIASNLAEDMPLKEAVRQAKAYVTGALAYGLNLGKGSGPLNHMWEFMEAK